MACASSALPEELISRTGLAAESTEPKQNKAALATNAENRTDMGLPWARLDRTRAYGILHTCEAAHGANLATLCPNSAPNRTPHPEPFDFPSVRNHPRDCERMMSLA